MPLREFPLPANTGFLPALFAQGDVPVIPWGTKAFSYGLDQLSLHFREISLLAAKALLAELN